MSDYNRYVIDGTTYYVFNNTLYIPRDVTHSVDEIEPDTLYVYQGNLRQLEYSTGLLHQVHIKSASHPTTTIDYVEAEDFEGATPLEPVVPAGYNECPECGTRAGKKDEPVECISCGYVINVE